MRGTRKGGGRKGEGRGENEREKREKKKRPRITVFINITNIDILIIGLVAWGYRYRIGRKSLKKPHYRYHTDSSARAIDSSKKVR